MSDVSVLSSYKNNIVVLPKILTGSGCVNRGDFDTISIKFTSNDFKNCNSDDIEIVEVIKIPVNIRFIHDPTPII